MNIARAHRTIRDWASLQVPKLVTVSAVSVVIFSTVGYVASASTNGHVISRPGSTFQHRASGPVKLRHSQIHHHGAHTTTTTTQRLGATTTTSGATTTPQPLTTTTTSQLLGATTTTSGETTTTQPLATTTTSVAPATTTLPVTTTTTATVAGLPYPVGDVSGSEPSGMAPPSGSALTGYRQSYVTDFGGTSLPNGWSSYSGKPGGDPGAQWADSHVKVEGGLLSLNTFQDSAYGGEWVAGGLCQCGVSHTYGAWFVRSRVTGAGPTNVELLWPSASVWPPEVDFNETSGVSTGTSATTIWAISGSSRSQVQSRLSVDMTLWHTWGVIWTPTAITYTVDGRAWGTVNTASEIPNQAMWLTLQQQTWCSSGFACPSAPQSMQVDWVAEYNSN